ncbi:MAG: RimJ/RimL family protein N-acetyltransferase [Oceanicoccus sp.]|jgi:RimJ/RimL family protein N-acetyltransferase
MTFEAVTLEGHLVKLEPLTVRHKEELCHAINDGELWNLYVTLVPRPKDIDSFLSAAIGIYNDATGLCFATIDKKTGKVVGSTRFMKADFPNRRVEIGSTFLSKSSQKTRINTEAKLLMLAYAFEKMNFSRVEFLTDHLNSKSRNAIVRLGAKEEGLMRNHMIMPDGRVRDSVIFSIIENEWPGIKQHLMFKLDLTKPGEENSKI